MMKVRGREEKKKKSDLKHNLIGGTLVFMDEETQQQEDEFGHILISQIQESSLKYSGGFLGSPPQAKCL